FSIDTDDNLYLSTSIYSESQMQIQKFENDSWQDIGEIDEILVGTYGMVFDSSNLPYCIFYVVDGASYTASVMKFDPTAGLETSVFNEVEMYPNPANGVVYIDNLPNDTTVTITDMTGKLIYSIKQVGYTLSIDTAKFAKGLYQVQITNSGKSIAKKLVVK